MVENVFCLTQYCFNIKYILIVSGKLTKTVNLCYYNSLTQKYTLGALRVMLRFAHLKQYPFWTIIML